MRKIIVKRCAILYGKLVSAIFLDSRGSVETSLRSGGECCHEDTSSYITYQGWRNLFFEKNFLGFKGFQKSLLGF